MAWVNAALARFIWAMRLCAPVCCRSRADLTNVIFTWLVGEGAQQGIDYDIDRMTALWDVTTRQDKRIIENNQAGVGSRHYEPGPYSQQEAGVVRFLRWYKGLYAGE